MKKMLVLALVLAVAGLANAGLSLEAVQGSSVASIVSDGTTAWAAYVTWSAPANNATGAFTALGAKSLSKNINLGINDMGEFGFAALGMAQVQDVSVAGGVGETITAGAHYTITLAEGLKFTSAPTAMRVDVLAYDLSGIVATAYVIPEPMTMAILGLGGLFLRKRK